MKDPIKDHRLPTEGVMYHCKNPSKERETLLQRAWNDDKFTYMMVALCSIGIYVCFLIAWFAR